MESATYAPTAPVTAPELTTRDLGPTRARSWLWLALGAITAAGVAVRFATLGLQSYHHDEVITAARVLPGSFVHMLREVRASESNPPLYYVLAWGWSKLFGTGEVGLRSLSALFGAATIPIAYLIGKELASRRTGLIAAALVALNPMLIWYSQEARSYSLLVVLSAASLLFFLRARRTGAKRDLLLWSLCSALALASHYFAAFPIAIEAAWLLAATRLRLGVILAAAGIAAAGVVLAPLAIAQSNPQHIGWISASPLSTRALHGAAAFMTGETGSIIGRKPRLGYAIIPGALAAIGILIAVFFAGRAGRRAALIGLAIGGGTVLLATLAALAGKDYVIARNLLPALVPLLAVAAAGFALCRLRLVGLALAAGLCVYWIGFAIHVVQTPSLQRPDWRDLAAKIDTSPQSRAIVSWKLAAAPLEFYLHGDAQRLYSGRVRAREIDVVAKPWAAPGLTGLPPGFRRVDQSREARLTLVRYRSARPRVIHYAALKALDTGYRINSILVDGGPHAARLGHLADTLPGPVS